MKGTDNRRGIPYRRSQEARVKKNARKKLKDRRLSYDLAWDTGKPDHEDPQSVGMKATTPCRCSCAMCGNPRKYEQGGSDGPLTIQERRAKLAWGDE